jgi:hypothetical protein
MNEQLTRKYLLAIALAVATTFAHAQTNECKAAVTPLDPVAAGSGTGFVFEVKTDCDASTGRFEYAFRVRGNDKPIVRNAPPWTVADGRSFRVKDTYGAPVGDVGKAVVSKIQSKKDVKKP